jgi:hypothetical protein
MKPVGRPGLTEKRRPNSEGGVRSGLCYHPKRRSATYQEHHRHQRFKVFCLPGESTRQGPPTPFNSYSRIKCHKGLDWWEISRHWRARTASRDLQGHIRCTLRRTKGFSAWLPEQRRNRATASTRCPRGAQQQDDLPHASQAPTTVGGRGASPGIAFLGRDSEGPSQGLGAYAPTMSSVLEHLLILRSKTCQSQQLLPSLHIQLL